MASVFYGLRVMSDYLYTEIILTNEYLHNVEKDFEYCTESVDYWRGKLAALENTIFEANISSVPGTTWDLEHLREQYPNIPETWDRLSRKMSKEEQ